MKVLAQRRHVPVLEALRQAIATELFIQRLVDEEAKLLVELTDGTLQQILFSQAQSASLPAASAATPSEGASPATPSPE